MNPTADQFRAVYGQTSSPHGELTVVHTTGLEKFDHPNFELLVEDDNLVPIAARLLGEAAAYSVMHTRVADNETVGIPATRGTDEVIGHNSLRACAVEAKVQGLFRKKTTSRLRLISPAPGADLEAPPNLALATEILEIAHEAVAGEYYDKALDLAAWSASVYPGEPGAEAFELQARENAENYHAYELLYLLTGQDELLREALSRSVRFQAAQLGAPATMLSELLTRNRRELVAMSVSAIQSVIAVYPSKLMEESSGSVPVSPIMTMKIDDERVYFHASAIPPEVSELYWNKTARAAMASEETGELVTDVLLANSHSVAELVAMTRTARHDWVDASVQELMFLPPTVIGLEQVASSLIAMVALCANANMSEAEMRAHFGIGCDAESAEATAKFAELEARHKAASETHAARQMLARFMAQGEIA